MMIIVYKCGQCCLVLICCASMCLCLHYVCVGDADQHALLVVAAVVAMCMHVG